MRQFTTHPTTPAVIDFNDLRSGAHYFADSLLHVQVYAGGESIEITDLTYAMRAGQTCQRVKFVAPWRSERCEVANLLHQCGGDLRELFALLASVEPQPYNAGKEVALCGYAGRVYNSQHPAIRTYSPFASLNVLKAAPARWTLAHVVRALVARQYAHLACNGHYTDDYAWDAAVNFGKGEASAEGLVQELVESPSGWWVSAEGECITIGCHGFKSYSFRLVLAGRQPTPTNSAPTLLPADGMDTEPVAAPANPATAAVACLAVELGVCTLPGLAATNPALAETGPQTLVPVATHSEAALPSFEITLLHGPAGFYVQASGKPVQGPYTTHQLRGGRFEASARDYAASLLRKAHRRYA